MAAELPNLVDTELFESTVPTHATVADTVSDSPSDEKTLPPATESGAHYVSATANSKTTKSTDVLLDTVIACHP